MFGSKFESREPDIFDGRTDGRTSIPRLVGASDWSAQTILVHLPSSLGLDVGSSGEYVLSDRLFDNLADHVSVLCEHIFLSSITSGSEGVRSARGQIGDDFANF